VIPIDTDDEERDVRGMNGGGGGAKRRRLLPTTLATVAATKSSRITIPGNTVSKAGGVMKLHKPSYL
jgi:hypothetical protein